MPDEKEPEGDKPAVVVDEKGDFLTRLENIQKSARAGNVAAVVAGVKAPEGTVKVHVKGEGADDDPASYVDPLRKNFESVAKFHRDFKHFGSDKALEDPISYLRETVVDMKGRRRYKVSNAELETAMQILLVSGGATRDKEGAGTPFVQWKDRHGTGKAIEQGFELGLQKGIFPEGSSLSKAIDSGAGSGGPLIRTDIDPLLREAYLRKFPLGDMIRRFPANGLVHTYDQRTAVGSASTVSELGDLSSTDSQSTYVRKANSNIAVLATRRQISLKLQYAVAQSGMSFDLSGSQNLEVIGALTAIARLNQALICQGNYTNASGTVNNEDGVWDNTTFDGLRTILKASGTSITKSSSDSYLRTINRAVGQVVNSGGDTDDLMILLSLGAKVDVEDELLKFLRVINTTPGGGFPTNLASNGLLTVTDTVSKLLSVPAAAQGEGIGYYDLAGTSVEDIYVADPNGMGLAYLGSPQPAILELPIGFNNALSNVYVPFLMNGLCVFVTSFHRKIRIPTQTL